MNDDQTTVIVQKYLDELAQGPGDTHAEPIIRSLLARSVGRLQVLCGALLYRKYPRLTQPPLNLQTDEMLSSVVERLLKALREVHPTSVRQFFALANQHMRWELNDLARRLDERSTALVAHEELIPSPESSGSLPNVNAVRILEAIEALPDEQREVFNLIRIQGMTHTEAAEILDVSAKTIQRRLAAGLLFLTRQLGDLQPQLRESSDSPAL